ncbi:MAG: ISNCY family transposase [Planctomycetes bacterium]|nr:ISNCY family transposase [Planctomycetota bacterium]
MGDIKMSATERKRLEMLSRVKDGLITQVKASEFLGISYRHTKRIYKRYREQGDKGLIHKNRGRPSNRRIEEKTRKEVLTLYRQKYWDFGPTLACEHLAFSDRHVLDHETLRLWLIKDGRWQKKRRRKKHRAWRERKEHVGELVQMDGSDHDWFEGRSGKAVLMVMVEDATSRTFARFFEGETTRASMETFQTYVECYGLPQALYVDRDSIYRCDRQPTVDEQLKQTNPLTQFGRAMNTLGVRIVPAYSPQAKGRVERTNGTFQDRLVKEMRLEGIKTIEEGNQFLEEVFLPKHNEKFNVMPKKEEDLHRPIPENIILEEVLCFEESRQVQNDWTVSWGNRFFQLTKRNEALGLVKQKITVREKLEGTIQLVYKGHNLAYTELPEHPEKMTVKVKQLAKSRKPWKPAPDHPWRRHIRRSYPQPLLDSDELVGAHSRRVAAGV